MVFGVFFGGCPASEELSEASTVAMRESRAGFAEAFGGAAMFRYAAVVGAVGMMSGFGNSEPFVPVM